MIIQKICEKEDLKFVEQKSNFGFRNQQFKEGF